MERALVRVDGRVQGVGFRWWAQQTATALGLAGYAENLPDGRVEVSLQGDGDAIARMIGKLTEQPSSSSRPGRVTGHTIDWVDVDQSQRSFRAY